MALAALAFSDRTLLMDAHDIIAEGHKANTDTQLMWAASQQYRGRRAPLERLLMYEMCRLACGQAHVRANTRLLAGLTGLQTEVAEGCLRSLESREPPLLRRHRNEQGFEEITLAFPPPDPESGAQDASEREQEGADVRSTAR